MEDAHELVANTVKQNNSQTFWYLAQQHNFLGMKRESLVFVIFYSVKMEDAHELVANTVKHNNKARGLAVIISNDYMDQRSQKSFLYGAIEDAEAMSNTLKYLNFAVIDRRNDTEKETKKIIKEVASYPEYPSSYDCFIVVFSGHGTGKPSIMSCDDKEVDIKEHIIDPLDSTALKNHPKLIFIDACQASGHTDHSYELPADFLIAYSTRYGYKSFENEGGGIWMQRLAVELKTCSSSVVNAIAKVNNDVKAEVGANQIAIYRNTTVNINLGKKERRVSISILLN